MATPQTEWQEMLKSDSGSTDILASLSESAINDFLRRHHDIDSDRYTLKVDRQFVENGRTRTFTLLVNAPNPVQVEFAPFATPTTPATRDGWNAIDGPDPLGPGLHVPEDPKADPNVRVSCEGVALTLRWPKWDNSGYWEWKPEPFTILAEAAIVLDNRDGAFFLHIEPTAIKFDKQVADFLRQRAVAQPAGTAVRPLTPDEQKFDDLLLIALDIAGAQFAPRLVRNVAVPAPIVASRAVNPSHLRIGNKLITIGAGIDRAAVASQNAIVVQGAQAQMQSLLARDVADHGSLIAALTVDRLSEAPTMEEIDAVQFIGEEEYPRRFPRLYQYLAELGERAAAVVPSDVPAVAPAAGSAAANGVRDGLGIAVNQYLLQTLARDAMPAPKDGCTDWAKVLDVVRGRVCWWLHLTDPVVTIGTNSVAGSLHVDIGGAIDACVRKFWDCSWRWDCGRPLSLAVVGVPGVSLQFVAGDGVSFYAQVTGKVRLATNLPWPFDKVVAKLSELVASMILGLINAVLANMKFTFVPPVIALPNQKTGLRVAGYTQPFTFQPQTASTNPAKTTFVGFLGSTEGVAT